MRADVGEQHLGQLVQFSQLHLFRLVLLLLGAIGLVVGEQGSAVIAAAIPGCDNVERSRFLQDRTQVAVDEHAEGEGGGGDGLAGGVWKSCRVFGPVVRVHQQAFDVQQDELVELNHGGAPYRVKKTGAEAPVKSRWQCHEACPRVVARISQPARRT